MYALALASQKEPATFAAISQVADGINHAVPTHSELQRALKWLITSGMAQKVGPGYLLTPQGSEVVASVRSEHSTTSQVWLALTASLGTLVL